MDGKQDKPPAYSPPKSPPPALQGQGLHNQAPQGYYYPGSNMEYYGGQPRGGPYPPQQFAQHPGQYGQPGYPPQGYPANASSRTAAAAGTGCLGALLGALACCCCLDILF